MARYANVRKKTMPGSIFHTAGRVFLHILSIFVRRGVKDKGGSECGGSVSALSLQANKITSIKEKLQHLLFA